MTKLSHSPFFLPLMFSLFLVVLATPSRVHADVTSVSGTTATSTVSIGASSPVTVAWTVSDTSSQSNGSGSVTIQSTFGTFVHPTTGAVYGTTPGLLSKTSSTFCIRACPRLPCFCDATTTAVFVDSIIVPRDIAVRALKDGLSTLGYRRTFTPAGSSSTGTVLLSLGSPSSSSFGISGEILSFDNGSSVRILPKNNAIQARAELGYNGTGLLQAVWEIAEPATTSGTPIYRPLLQVSEYLMLGDTKTLKSPPLPSGTLGLHLVRLRVIDPIVPFTTPAIRYFVAEGRVGKELPPDPVGVTSPVPFALYAPDTLFAWESHKGTKAYQLEVYRTDRNPATELPDLGGGDRAPKPSDVAAALHQAPVTGMLVPSNQNSTTLSANARQRLVPGRAYLWRVLAISEDGTVIGQSPMREMRTP